jgi:hypothetical protein
MKQFNLKKLSFPLLISLVCTAFIIHSCKKDNKTQPLADPELNQAKTWYESTYPVAGNSRMLITQNTRPLLPFLISASISSPTGTMQKSITGWVKM